MNKQFIIEQAKHYAQELHDNDTTGHDYAHILRVRHHALQIAKYEDVDFFTVELASLLHDSVDKKLFKDNDDAWVQLKKWMHSVNLTENYQKELIHILKYVSYNGGQNKGKLKSLAGLIVQDADRLDAIGAIGIARTFQYAGHFNEPMHIPSKLPRQFNKGNSETYHKEPNSAINHFYEKLLLLKDLMNTEKGKALATQRHIFMEQFLTQFYSEWHLE